MEGTGIVVAFALMLSGDRVEQPMSVARHARPSATPAYHGYYVGGGSAAAGETRARQEGTWGWDYSPWFLPRRIALAWNHGRRHQGGTGAYKTDGPPLPDVPARIKDATHLHRQ
jgi:hypothetical protein